MPDRLSQLSPSTVHTVGNTPIVQLRKVVPKNCADVLIKLEYFNPTGSYKDRMALAMIEEAERRGDLRPGMTVVEYTGGSTGSSLAFVCAVKGYTFKVVSSDAFAKEKLDTMRAFGAELEIISSQNGKITPDLIPRMIERAKNIAQADNTYFTDQFNNTDIVKGHARIGYELLHKDYYDEAMAIDEAEARQMARRLAREEGIFSGTSTGLNVVGALQLALELGPGQTVVTVAVDTGLKYLAGDLYEA